MSSPRDHIRAAQAAELRGDKAIAVAELLKAAELFRKVGNSARALQLLRHARTLDSSRVDIAEQINKLEWLPDNSIAGALEGPGAGEPVLELKLDPDELAERQRLIEEALREAGVPNSVGDTPDEVQRWLVEESSEPKEAVDLHGASERALEWARQQEEEEKALEQWSGEEPKAEEDARPVLAEEVEEMPFEEPAPSPEPSLFDRGPTRADPALDAWCSFCCRPRAEVGEMVAGPTGSFICAACVGESQLLLGLEHAAPSARPQPAKRRDDAGTLELVGQQEARALLTRGLEAGARRVLVIGPEGCGKTVWFQQLASQELGAPVTIDALEQGAGGATVLMEDVDRLSPEAQARLGAFLARHPERTVLMSARGGTQVPSFLLQGAGGSLPMFTSSSLFPVVRGAVPLALLDQLQLVIPLQEPTEAEFIEIARKRLAARGSEVSLSDDVLAAFAGAAARSPRLGHELTALLARVLAGSWRLQAFTRDMEDKGPVAKEVGGKPPARRGRRKGPA